MDMNKIQAKLMKELRKDPMYELCNDEQLAAFAEEIQKEVLDYEARMRKADTPWPENLIVCILDLKWVKLRESVEEELSELLDTLTARESKIIEMFYKEGKGIFEIAEEFNVSYAMIRFILARGTGKLRQPARAKWLAELVEEADKELVIRTFDRERYLREDDEESEGEEDNEDEEDDFIKHLFDDPDDEEDRK